MADEMTMVETNSVAARFARLDGICSRILWTEIGVPALENAQTKTALEDLCEYLFAAGIDAALSEPAIPEGGEG